MKFFTHSVAETERLGERLGRALRGDEIIAFTGGLGMGKTAFVRGLARGLGSDADVTSPTFALMNQYTGGRADLLHFDVYRIHGFDALYDIGFFDWVGSAVIAIEWSENIADALPDNVLRVDIARGAAECDRIITIDDSAAPLSTETEAPK